MNARTGLEPRGGDDDRVHEGPLDAVVDGRLVAFVDDADGHEHHAGPDVEAARDQEVEIGLFELHLAGLLEALDERVLQFQLAHEPDAGREAVGEEQNEAMKVHARVLALVLVDMEVHVPGQRAR